MPKATMNTIVTDIKGELRAGIWLPGIDPQEFSNWASNLLQFGGADLFAALAAGDTAACPNAMYLEFTNNVAGWSSPTVDRSSAVAYFNSLDASANGDFLRVPLAGNPSRIATSANYVGNSVSFMAMSAGTAGVFGKDFSNAAGSCLVGGAIVNVRDWDDRSQDTIVTRGYLSSTIAKQASPSEVIMQWKITFG